MDYSIFGKELQEILDHKNTRFNQLHICINCSIAFQWGVCREQYFRIYIDKKL